MHRPSLVVGFGGYPSLMPVAVAQWLGVPTIVHEQNHHLGKANRYLSQRAHHVWLTHPSASSIPHAYVVGNFVRPALIKATAWVAPKPESPLKILVVGGSQGASVLGAQTAQYLAQTGLKLEIVHQCRDLNATQQVYNQHGIAHHVAPFLKDMEARYAWAHLVITRAGAGTISELIATRRPAIFVPFSASIEGDQKYNAQYASAWSWTIPEQRLKDLLPQTLRSIHQNINILAEKVCHIPKSHMDIDHVWNDIKIKLDIINKSC